MSNKLTPKEEQKLKDALVEMYGDRLANGEHFPKLYDYQLRLFILDLKARKQDGRTVPTTSA